MYSLLMFAGAHATFVPICTTACRHGLVVRCSKSRKQIAPGHRRRRKLVLFPCARLVPFLRNLLLQDVQCGLDIRSFLCRRVCPFVCLALLLMFAAGLRVLGSQNILVLRGLGSVRFHTSFVQGWNPHRRERERDLRPAPSGVYSLSSVLLQIFCL